MKALKDVPVGKSSVVVKIHGEGALRRRIVDVGITKDTEVYVRKMAPLDDPVGITIRGYELSFHRADTEILEMQ